MNTFEDLRSPLPVYLLASDVHIELLQINMYVRCIPYPHNADTT